MKFLPFFLLASICACATFEDHLKPALNKGDYHHIRNIDFIYMINLDARPERWEKSRSQLGAFGIYPYRFSAVCGWDLSLEAINDVGLKLQPGMKTGERATYYPLDGDFTSVSEPMSVYGRTYFCHCVARGTIGICLSHLSVIKDAFDSGYETIWVMEDDIEVVRDPHIISELIDLMDSRIGKDGWDILFTDRDYRNAEGTYIPCPAYDLRRPDYDYSKAPNTKYRGRRRLNQVRRVVGHFGATSMIVRRSGMRKLLEFYRKHAIYFPYDIDFAMPYDISLYTVQQDIVSNLLDSTSDNGSYLKDKNVQ